MPPSLLRSAHRFAQADLQLCFALHQSTSVLSDMTDSLSLNQVVVEHPHAYYCMFKLVQGMTRHSVTSSEEGSYTNCVKSKVALIFISGFQ